MGKIKIICFVFSFALFVFIPSNSFAQEDMLKKPITAEFKNVRLNDAFRQIEKQISIYFAFDGSILDINRKITKSFKDTPLDKCLDEMLEDSSLFYKVIENHVVIRCCKQFTPVKIDTIEVPKFLTLSGRIFDRINRDPLPFASVGIEGQGLGVVSNSNGEFVLKIPVSLESEQVCVSCLGYNNICLSVKELSKTPKDFPMDRNYISIQEVIIRKTDARNLIRGAIKNREKNYSNVPVYLTGFYREAVNKSKKYMFYSEAVMQIYKSSYTSEYDADMVKILKSRKMQDISMEDTVVVKLKSGLQASLGLDIVKNPSDFLNEENFDQYKYVMSDIVSIDNRSAYLIEFEPRENADEALFEGKLYIDIQTLAIISCQFGISKSKIRENQGRFIAKKDKGIKLKISNISYEVSYRQIGDKYYLNYARGDINMRVRKKSRLFFFDFDISFELAINDLETNSVERFKRKDAARLETIFFDEIYAYDESFWKQYNFILPDKSLEEAFRKSRK